MWIIEVWERGKYREIKYSVKKSKNDLEAEVAELNKLVKKEEMKFAPVTNKYRVKKIKKVKNEISPNNSVTTSNK